MAILALGLAGAGLTSAIGIGASIGWMGGVMLGNLLFGGSKGQTTEGPKLDDLSVQTSTYGSAIPLLYGTMRTAGNVIWSTNLKETRHEQHQRGGKGGGGGGSTQISYTYSVSFAVGLCAGPVSTVRRIWADTKLIYDATASNTQAMEKYPGVVRIHAGCEDQQPDSTIEMHEGVGNVPAYRGLCYLTFTDLQLADFANRIPNVSAEVVGAGAMDCNAVILPKVSQMYRDGGVIDAARGTLIGLGINKIFKYDLVGNKLLLQAPLALGDIYGDLAGIDSEGYYYHASDAYGVGMHLAKRHPDSLAIVAKTEKRVDFSVSGTVMGGLIFVHRSRKVYDLDFELVADLSETFPFPGNYYGETPICRDGGGTYWQASYDALRNSDGASSDISSLTGNVVPDAIFWDDFTGHLFIRLDLAGRLIKWDPSSGYAGHLDGVVLGAGWTLQSHYNFPLNGRLWAAAGTTAQLVDLVSMRIEKTIDLSPYLPSTATHFSGCYEKFTHSVVIMTDAGEIKYPLERYGSDKTSLADTIEDICLKAGLQTTDLLVNEVSQPLRGYIVNNRMAARDALEPLLGAFFVDAVETDGVLKFKPRGGASAASVPYNDLGAVEGSNNDAPLRVTETRKQDVELPQRIDLTHIDPDRDFQTNTQHAARITGIAPTLNKETVQLTMNLTADDAAQIADMTLRNAWIERNSYTFNLPPKWLRLDPADVIEVELQDAVLTLRLNQVDFGGNNIVACKAVAEDEISYVSNAKGTSVALPSIPIGIATPISLFLMDAPMLRVEDDGIGLTYAFGIRNGSSASLYRSPDELAWSIVGTGINAPAFGWAASVLADTPRPWTWDEDNKVQIALAHGSLDSKTALEVLNWGNAALLGNEIIQWRNATLLSEGLYELSGLLRGRRGTEGATASHKAGEKFVVLASEGLYRIPLPSTEIGKTSYYKAMVSGGNWDDAPEISQTFNAASLRCFSPVHITGSRNGAGDLTITWMRRTRWYGEWLDNVDVPLFEDAESYAVDIYSGDQIVRTLAADTPTTIYTAAEQTADFGAAQSVLAVAIYQLNAIIGRGTAGKAVI